MVRSTAPSVLLSGKVISGRLLDNAGAMVETKIDKIIRSETVGLVADGWKSITKFIYDITKSNFFLQSQLTLGDYFKEYEFAQGIAEAATGLIGWINNRGKVRRMFNEVQKQISLDTDGKEKVVREYDQVDNSLCRFHQASSSTTRPSA